MPPTVEPPERSFQNVILPQRSNRHNPQTPLLSISVFRQLSSIETVSGPNSGFCTSIERLLIHSDATSIIPRMLEHGLSGAITKIRLRKGLKQEDAAFRAGVDPSNWSKWETGERHPQRRQLDKITTGLDCDEVELGLEASLQSFEHYSHRARSEGLQVDSIKPQEIDPLATLDVERLPLKMRPSIRSLRDGLRHLNSQLMDLFQLIVEDSESETSSETDPSD